MNSPFIYTSYITHISQQIAITPTPHLHAPQHPSSPPTLTKPPTFLLNSISVQEQKSAVIPSSSSKEQWCLLRAELAVSNRFPMDQRDVRTLECVLQFRIVCFLACKECGDGGWGNSLNAGLKCGRKTSLICLFAVLCRWMDGWIASQLGRKRTRSPVISCVPEANSGFALCCHIHSA